MHKIHVFWDAVLCRQVNSDSVSSELTLNIRDTRLRDSLRGRPAGQLPRAPTYKGR